MTEQTTKPVNHILYHGGNCHDGFMAAYLMKRFLELGDVPVQATAVNYNEPMPDVTGQDVTIVDFSYSPEVIAEARKIARGIVMFDHHEKAVQMWGGYGDKTFDKTEAECELMLKLVENQSGAMIVYSFLKECVNDLVDAVTEGFIEDDDTKKFVSKVNAFIDNERLKKIVERIDDRDRWVFNYEDTNLYRSVLSSIPFTFEAWDKLIEEESNQDFEARLSLAEAYADKEEQICQSLAKHAEMINLGGYTIPAVNCPAQFGSRVGEIIGKDHPFSLTYCLDSKIVYCSFRSSSVHGIDVSAFATKWGGGGHIHAAGCKLTPAQLVDLLSGQL